MEVVTGGIGTAAAVDEKCTTELGVTLPDGSRTVDGLGTGELAPTCESPGVLSGKHLENRGWVMPCARIVLAIKLGLFNLYSRKASY